MLKDAVDDAGPVEAGDHRQPAGDRRGLVPADLLQPAHVELDVRPGGGQRIEVVSSHQIR